jgi:hypothetical protein
MAAKKRINLEKALNIMPGAALAKAKQTSIANQLTKVRRLSQVN